MVLKYKNKIYSSEDLPILLFFKALSNKRNFINEVSNYVSPKEFIKLTSIDVALAGNTVMKDKRCTIYLKFESLEEKKSLLRQIHNTPEDSNAVISTPEDIEIRIIEMWIERHVSDLV